MENKDSSKHAAADKVKCLRKATVDSDAPTVPTSDFSESLRTGFADSLRSHLSKLHSTILDEHEKFLFQLLYTHVHEAWNCGPRETHACVEVDEALSTDQTPAAEADTPLFSGARAAVAHVSAANAADAERDVSNESQSYITEAAAAHTQGDVATTSPCHITAACEPPLSAPRSPSLRRSRATIRFQEQQAGDSENQELTSDAAKQAATFKMLSKWTANPGDALTEAVLWTKWEHCGNLYATQQCLILALDAALFGEVVKESHRTHMHAVRYAKHFVWRLNQQDPFIDDRTSFEDLDISTLNESLFDGSLEQHFVFLSHYKVEAGTEATLISEQMSRLLDVDIYHHARSFKHPIFVDSENLTDLANLKLHVVNSDILMLLLTPGLLTRPWCLFEIVTAIKYNVSIVLVEIQRPGSRFQYPDDKFYDNFRAGKLLDTVGVSLLETEGITLEEVEKAIRRAFLKIAMPFSPHRNQEVRKAELTEILRRCKSVCEHSRQLSKQRSELGRQPPTEVVSRSELGGRQALTVSL